MPTQASTPRGLVMLSPSSGPLICPFRPLSDRRGGCCGPSARPSEKPLSPVFSSVRFFANTTAKIWYTFRVNENALGSQMLKQAFTDFIFATNTDGSGKAASYVRALDMLGPILTRHYPHPIIRGTMWQRFSLADIQAIHKWICAETKKGAASPAAEFASPRDMSICSIQKAVDEAGRTSEELEVRGGFGI